MLSVNRFPTLGHSLVDRESVPDIFRSRQGVADLPGLMALMQRIHQPRHRHYFQRLQLIFQDGLDSFAIIIVG